MPACVALFDAYAAGRAEQHDEAVANGDRAALIFHEIEWPYHEAQASELSGNPKAAMEIYRLIGDARDARRLEVALNPTNRRGRSKNALTSREREISQLIIDGKSNRAIADALVISERTVESHVSSILSKLDLTSRAELIARLKEK
jgi:DNA-binding NarL/FixJ family response regulator